MNRPAKVTQGEIARAVRVAKAAGGMCVEIMPDGTIRIRPIEPLPPQGEKEPLAQIEDAVL